MTSTIKVNTITESGSTLTVGGCGNCCFSIRCITDRFWNWNKLANNSKTGTLMLNGEGYFVDTTSGTITMTMPSVQQVLLFQYKIIIKHLMIIILQSHLQVEKLMVELQVLV